MKLRSKEAKNETKKSKDQIMMNSGILCGALAPNFTLSELIPTQKPTSTIEPVIDRFDSSIGN